MLYNRKWDEQKKQDARDIFTMESLIAWLEKRDPSEPYDHADPRNCLFAQYFRDHGYPKARCGGDYVRLYGSGTVFTRDFPDGWIHIFAAAPYTFGAALERARTVHAGLSAPRLP